MLKKIYLKLQTLIFIVLLIASNVLSVQVYERYKEYTALKKSQVSEKPEKSIEKEKSGNKERAIKKNKAAVWYEKRYDIAENPHPLLFTNYSKGTIKREDLEKTIRAVFQRLPNLYIDQNLVLLLLETAEVESLRGKLVENNLSSATGIFQILPSTAKDTLKWTRENHRDVYKSIMGMYNRKLSLSDNLFQNVPFSIAIASTYYWRMNPYLYHKITSIEERAKIWRVSYNTYLDPYGSKQKYLRTVQYCKKHNI